jgi:hypothetical protein
MAEDTKNGEQVVKKGEKLIVEGCKAYGIDAKYLHASRIDAETGEAVILTVGGKRVRYKSGQKVQPLSEIEITGVNPAWAKKKPIAGKKKEEAAG